MLIREDALAAPDVEKEYSAKGGRRVPRPDVLDRYAPAVELYRTTDLPLTELSKRCKVSRRNKETHAPRWHTTMKRQRTKSANPQL